MANRIKYKVKCVPIEELVTHDATLKKVLASEVKTKLGGVGTSMQDISAFAGAPGRQGYSNKSPYYVDASYSTQVNVSEELIASLMVIKNTGKAFSSTGTLGTDLDLSLKIMAGPNDKTVIGVVEPGGAVVLPCNTAANISCGEIYVQTVEHSGSATTSGSLAVEFFVGNVNDGLSAGMIVTCELNIMGSGN